MSDMEHAPHAAEAKERWGDTDAYKESAKRTKDYSKADWDIIKGQSQSIEKGLADAMKSGEPADGERAMDLAEQARLHIGRWFYPCSHAMHANLADMYTADARFRAHYDEQAVGLADYVADAIRANGARQNA